MFFFKYPTIIFNTIRHYTNNFRNYFSVHQNKLQNNCKKKTLNINSNKRKKTNIGNYQI